MRECILSTKDQRGFPLLKHPSKEQEPENLKALGFDDAPRGIHTHRTIMLKELEAALLAMGSEVSPKRLRDLAVNQNALGKATMSGRREVATRLVGLYSFDEGLPLVRAFMKLWAVSNASQPILALLMALSRDAILRTTANWMSQVTVGTIVTPKQIEGVLANDFTAKYAEPRRAEIARRIASSWKQSGHLRAGHPTVRAKASADPAATAFAIYVGYLRGARGKTLLDTVWVRLLDFESSEREVAIAEAHREGLITYKKIGEVVDIAPGPYILEGAAA
jgi:hypothetical protein